MVSRCAAVVLVHGSFEATDRILPSVSVAEQIYFVVSAFGTSCTDSRQRRDVELLLVWNWLSLVDITSRVFRTASRSN